MFDGSHAIGVDGTGRRKGHAYITVIVDHGRGRVIWAHDGHGRQVPGLFFRQLTPERRASIRIVTGDGAGRIDASVAEHRPNAERVLDPFHIVSWMTDALDRVGKRLWNQARRDGNTTAAGAMRGVEYAVPGNPGDLTERQSTALATLADADPKGQLPLVAAQGTPAHAPAPARRTGRSGTQTMDRPGVPLPHPRDRRTMREDPQTPRRHPHNHQARLFQRRDRSVQQQDQGHHPHGLRLPRHGQPHRHDQTQMLRTTHPPANTHPLTHENNRNLLFYRGIWCIRNNFLIKEKQRINQLLGMSELHMKNKKTVLYRVFYSSCRGASFESERETVAGASPKVSARS